MLRRCSTGRRGSSGAPGRRRPRPRAPRRAATGTPGSKPGGSPRSGDGNGFATRLRRGLRALRRARPHPPPPLAGLGPARAEAGRTTPPRRSSATGPARRPRATPASRSGSASTTSRSRAGSPTTSKGSATTRRAGWCGAATSTGWRRPSATWSPGGSRSTSPPSTPSAAPVRRPPARPPRPPRGRPGPAHDPSGRRRRRPPAAHAGDAGRHHPGPLADLHGGGHRRVRGRRGSARRAHLGARGPTPSSSTQYDYLGFSYYSALGVRGDGSIGRWPVDGRPGPQGYVRLGRGLRPRARSGCPRTIPTDRSSCARPASAPTTSQSGATTSTTSLGIAGGGHHRRRRPRGHLLVDRRRQLRVGQRLRRAVRPLRPRPQPQARRREVAKICGR